MSKQIVDLLDVYLRFSNRDKQTLVTLFNQGNLTQAHLSGSGGAGRSVITSNTVIDASQGIEMYNSLGQPSIRMDPEGTAFFGQSTNFPDKTSLVTFSREQDYNDERMSAGDLLIGDNSSNKANLFWDQSTGKLNLRSGITSGIVLSTDGSLQSGNYSPNYAGWQISAGGDAEFNSITARGKIRTAVFEKGHVVSTGGSILVAKNVGETSSDTSLGVILSSGVIYVKDDEDGYAIAAVGDDLYIQQSDGVGGTDYHWVDVTLVTDQGNGTHKYNVTVGGTSIGAGTVSYDKGTAVTNYGQSGDGVIELTAGEFTRIVMRENDGTISAGGVVRSVYGDLYNYFGAGANHYYGLGVGDYSGGNYLVYNNDGTNKFLLSAGGGYVALDGDGITLTTQTATSPKSQVKWETSGVLKAYLEAWDTGTNTNIHLHSLSSGGMADTQIGGFAAATYEGSVMLIADSGTVATASLELTADSNASPTTKVDILANQMDFSGSFNIDGGMSLGDKTPSMTVPNGSLYLDDESGNNYAFMYGKGSIYIGANAYYDGSQWRTGKTGKGAYAGSLALAGYSFNVAADDTSRSAGAIRTMTSVFRVDMTGDTNTVGGSMVGSLSLQPGTGDVGYSGNLRPYKNSAFYDAYAYVPLNTTVSVWSTQSVSNTASWTRITLSSSGLPENIQAVNVRCFLEDTGTITDDLFFALGESNGNWGVVVRPQVSSIKVENSGPVNCDASGDIGYIATKAGTMYVWIEILGYWI
jgi:hypothetical protein